MSYLAVVDDIDGLVGSDCSVPHEAAGLSRHDLQAEAALALSKASGGCWEI